MTSVPGAAVTSLRIDGVQHEFSSIKGVIEDVSQIIQNLWKTYPFLSIGAGISKLQLADTASVLLFE